MFRHIALIRGINLYHLEPIILAVVVSLFLWPSANAGTNFIVDDFNGPTLHTRWTVIGGNSASYSFDTGWAHVEMLSSDLLHFSGPWYELVFQTPLDAPGDFEIELKFSFDRTANVYQSFEFVLIDTAAADVIGTRLWNSPSQNCIAWADGSHEIPPLPPCWTTFTSPINATRLVLKRVADVVSIVYDNTTVLTCQTDRVGAHLRMEFMILSPGPEPFGFAADYLKAFAVCSELLGDADCSGVINIGDVAKLIDYIFQGGPAPICGQ